VGGSLWGSWTKRLVWMQDDRERRIIARRAGNGGFGDYGGVGGDGRGHLGQRRGPLRWIWEGEHFLFGGFGEIRLGFLQGGFSL
jgi:hypothetical protein